MHHKLRYKNSTLVYQKSGQGTKTLLLFHGFGQHHRAFDDLSKSLAPHYTLYAFDLFFHGASEWNQGEQALEKKVWQEILLQFLAENNIERFSVLGFSLGGKFALASLELLPDQIDRVILLAPDGIKTNFWYSLATYPLLLRRFFKSLILHPGRFYAITAFLHAMRIVDNGLLRFARHQMDAQEKRARVYYSWVVFRHLKFDIPLMAGLIQQYKINLTLMVGKYDKIITLKNMQQLLRHLPACKADVLDTGHNGVIAASIPILLRTLSD